MVTEARTTLSGLVEVDDAFIGGPIKGKKGRGAAASKHKSLVVGAVAGWGDKDDGGKRRERAGRLRLAMISDAGEKSRGSFLTRHVELGRRVRTDGWPGYSETAVADDIHPVRVIGSAQRAHKRFPPIHRVFSHLTAWLNGPHHGVEPQHLSSYVDEFVFRFNRRNTPMAAFQTLRGISSPKKPVSLAELMQPEST